MDDDDLTKRTADTQKYLDSLYDMSGYELREEIHALHLRCCMLNSYLARIYDMLKKCSGE